MQARCPLCSTVFPASRSGVQFCPSCGGQIDVPATGAPEAPAAAAAAPVPRPGGGSVGWERQGELGVLRAYWDTWLQSLIKPQEFWATVRPDGGLKPALIYAWITMVLYALPGLPIAYLMMGRQMEPVLKMLQETSRNPAMEGWVRRLGENMGVFVFGSGIAGLLLLPLSLIITAAVLHLFAMMTGCAKNGFNATFRVVAYSMGPQVLAWIPCVGAVAGLYRAVLIVMGLAKLHDSTIGRALAAILIPIGVLMLCLCGGVAVFAVAAASALGPH